jgi:hypothetical protein
MYLPSIYEVQKYCACLLRLGTVVRIITSPYENVCGMIFHDVRSEECTAAGVDEIFSCNHHRQLVQNYRSFRDLLLPLSGSNVINLNYIS